MHIRLKDYGRNQKKRKEYNHQSGLLIAEVDVNKAKHGSCIGTWEGIISSGFWGSIMSTYELTYAPNPLYY